MKMLKILSVGATFVMISAFQTVWATDIKVYKSPWCGCCTAWSQHMRDNGFNVTEIKREDMVSIKQELGVPQQLESCHTAVVEGYVIEGHVPAQDVKRLLAEKSTAKGLSAPGMPVGSPGMEQGSHKDHYNVVSFGEEGMHVYARH